MRKCESLGGGQVSPRAHSAGSVDARKELEKKRTENREGEMHLPGNRPNFEKLVADYQKSAQFLGKS
jgi:hypothetical protein